MFTLISYRKACH